MFGRRTVLFGMLPLLAAASPSTARGFPAAPGAASCADAASRGRCVAPAAAGYDGAADVESLLQLARGRPIIEITADTAAPPSPAPPTPAPTPPTPPAPPACAVGDSVSCPGSGIMCAGNQCCPSVNGSGTFVCPSAEPGWNQCNKGKQEDCVGDSSLGQLAAGRVEHLISDYATKAKLKEFCTQGKSVQCPGSTTYCAGDQCCPSINGSGTFVCPSASNAWNMCNAPKQDNCLVCSIGESVPCTGSGIMCAGNQCCPSVDGSGTSVCPSADPGFNQCNAPKQDDCVGAAPPTPGPAPAPTPIPAAFCTYGDSVECPGSDAMCAGNQCCPNAGGGTSVCPSAAHGWNDCDFPKQEDCLDLEPKELYWVKHTLSAEKYPMAKCLDGTMGAFYTLNAPFLDQKKWITYYNGGGWCATNVPYSQQLMVDNCYNRSKGSLGTSANPQAQPELAPADWWAGPMSANRTNNPSLWDFFKVVLVYCDGGSFTGRRKKPYTDRNFRSQLYFRGGYINEAVIETLKAEFGLTKARQAVVHGVSAGGLATYLHANAWKRALSPDAFIVAMPDSGFFLDWSSTKPLGAAHNYHDQMRSIFAVMESITGVNKQCVAAKWRNGNSGDCMFAQHTLPYIDMPVYALQSTVDSWQIPNVLGAICNKTGGCNSCTCYANEIPPCQYPKINTFQKYFTATVAHAFGASRPADTAPWPARHSGSGQQPDPNPASVVNWAANHRQGFVSSCSYHCNLWDHLKISDTIMDDAFTEWYNAQLSAWHIQAKGVQRYFETKGIGYWQEHVYPCNESLCCNGPFDKDPFR